MVNEQGGGCQLYQTTSVNSVSGFGGGGGGVYIGKLNIEEGCTYPVVVGEWWCMWLSETRN